jgi:hypothetical protein
MTASPRTSRPRRPRPLATPSAPLSRPPASCRRDWARSLWTRRARRSPRRCRWPPSSAPRSRSPRRSSPWRCFAAFGRQRSRPRSEVEPVALLDNALHLEPLQTDKAANVVPHPLFLLAPRSMTTRSLKGAADVSSPSPSPPLLQQDPSFRPARRGRYSAGADREHLAADVSSDPQPRPFCRAGVRSRAAQVTSL